MAYQQHGQCFETVDQAAAYAGAHSNGLIMAGPSGPVGVTFAGYQGGALHYTLTSSAGTSTLQVPYLGAQCQLIDTPDALALSWAVVGAWAVAYGVRLAVRAINQ